MFKKIVFVASLLIASFTAQSSHILGGDITWDCLGNGKYTFKVTVFVSCDTNSVAPAPSVTIQTDANVPPIVCQKINSYDVSPNCGGNNNIACGTSGGLKRVEYISAEITLPGVPPAKGWIFHVNLCCRIPLTNSQSSGTKKLHSYMFATSGMGSPNPCFDSSPDFLDVPHIYFTSSTHHNVALADLSDVDGDSVIVEWSRPWDGYSTQTQTPVYMPFDSAYSYTTPLPNTQVNPSNIEGVLNEASGNFQFYSVTAGTFANSLKLTSYRNGQKIAEVNRDLPIIIAPNISDPGVCLMVNSNPSTSVTSLNQHTLVAEKNSIGDTAFYLMQVKPGDTVSLKVSGFDSDLKPNCLPQDITFTASGAALSLDSIYQDSSLTGVNGVAATLKPFGSQNGFVVPSSNKVEFNWIIEKSHATSPGNSTYQFNFRFMDNNCNIPGTAETVVRIQINRPIVLEPDTAIICKGDSALANVKGDLSNLSWSPQTGVSSGSVGVFYLNPSQSTFYSLTDLNTGISENIFVKVDSIVTPVISVVSNQLELMNPTLYDSTYWTLNQVPIYSPIPNNKITPTLSGTYRTMNTNGVCMAKSNEIDTNISGNFSINPDISGTYNNLDSSNITYAMNVRYNGATPLPVNYITIAANYSVSNPKLKLKIYDVNMQQILSTDSVLATQDNQLEVYGNFTLQPQSLYFITIYLGDSANFHVYKAKNWPVMSSTGYISVFNAARANGEVLIPTTNSQSFPYIHLNYNGFIGIDENTLQTPFEIYPNPAHTMLYMTQINNYQILNVSGLVVLHVDKSNKVDVSTLPKGMYLIKNSTGVVVKFVKQ